MVPLLPFERFSGPGGRIPGMNDSTKLLPHGSRTRIGGISLGRTQRRRGEIDLTKPRAGPPAGVERRAPCSTARARRISSRPRGLGSRKGSRCESRVFPRARARPRARCRARGTVLAREKGTSSLPSFFYRSRNDASSAPDRRALSPLLLRFSSS